MVCIISLSGTVVTGKVKCKANLSYDKKRGWKHKTTPFLSDITASSVYSVEPSFQNFFKCICNEIATSNCPLRNVTYKSERGEALPVENITS